MNTSLQPDQRSQTDSFKIAHAYCRCQEPIGPGSVALCGYVKKNRSQPMTLLSDGQVCVVCDDLYMLPCLMCGGHW